MALRNKILWLVLNGTRLWSQIIKHKYLKNLPVDIWLRQKTFKVQGTSHMWNGFIHAMSWITRYLGWKIGNGKNIKVGIDPIAGVSSEYTLPEDLRSYLEDYGILTLSDALNRGIVTSSTDYWISTDELELCGPWKEAWNNYIKGLQHGGIPISNQPDKLVWMFNKSSGMVKANLMYDLIANTLVPNRPDDLLIKIWKY